MFSGAKSQDASQVISPNVKMTPYSRRSGRSASTSCAVGQPVPVTMELGSAFSPVADRKSWLPASSDSGSGGATEASFGFERVLGLIGDSSSLSPHGATVVVG